MTSTIEALQALYVAMGGNLTDTYANIDGGAPVSNLVRIPDMINAIAGLKASGATAELPAVKNTDNGSVLTVVSGKWAKAAVPTELPTVSASENGKVLKVIDGAWAVGTDNIE